jgi:PAS domain S-box-containing protein
MTSRNKIDSDDKQNALDGEALTLSSRLEELTRKLAEETGLRKSLQEAQQHGHLEWKSTFNTLNEPIIILDKNREIVKANDAAQTLLSSETDDIIGRKCYQLFIGSTSQCAGCLLEKVKHSGTRQEIDIERPFLGKILRVSCAPIFDGKELVGYIHSAHDISHQRSLEKQLIQAQKMEAVATLAGGIAHDFNNILGAILGNADLLLYRLPDSFTETTADGTQISVGEIQEHLAAIRKASLRAKELVSQILAFSRQKAAECREVVISPVIKEAVKLLQSSLPATIELHATLAPDIGSIYADPTQIHQVLMNLCTNAVDALENRHGRIDISLYEVQIASRQQQPSSHLKKGEYIVLTVRDNGIGMSDEIKDRIFEPFFTTREVGDGTGMGLAVLHGIVTAHNGVVVVSSAPGKGSEFSVYFPKVVLPEKSKVQNKKAASLPTGSETIIFADDEEDIVKMLTMMLEHLGYNVIPAAGGEQVLSYLKNHLQEVDMLITDQTMRDMTGLELAKEVHDLRQDLPIILCSGYSETLSSNSSEQQGIKKFLAKPIKMKDLAETIRQVFSER